MPAALDDWYLDVVKMSAIPGFTLAAILAAAADEGALAGSVVGVTVEPPLGRLPNPPEGNWGNWLRGNVPIAVLEGCPLT